MIRQLVVPRFALAEHKRAVWQASVPAGVDFEDVKTPEFFAHVAKKITICDRIEVLTDDGLYFAELLVQDVGSGYVKTAVLRFVELAPPIKVEGEATKFDVKWMGPHKKHVVIRKSDNFMVREGLATKSEAHDWVAGHVKAMAA